MKKFAVGTVIFGFAVAFSMAFGWVSNIIKFAKLDFKAPYKAEILRGIGIPVAPLGAVEGFIKIKD